MPNRATHGTISAMDVLVVDDQALSREVLSEALRPLGCHIRQAADAHEALAELKLHRYPLMFIDLMMPGMDGYELTRAIRRMEKERGLPPATIVAFSGTLYAENGEIVPLEHTRLEEQGFNDGLAKPLTLETLQHVIDARFPQGAPMEAPQEPTKQPEPSLVVENSTIWKVSGEYNNAYSKAPFTRALVLDDDRFMLLTTQTQLERHVAHVDIAETPEKALKMFCQHPYHLLVLDLEMPGINGFQMAQKFRLLEAPTAHRTCIVALSGHMAGHDVIMQCAASGMDDCLAKPLDPTMLKTRLDLWQKGIHPATKLIKH